MNNPKIEFDDRMLSRGLARVSEAAAIASVSLIGRGDEKAADEAAVNAMREQLNLLDISGTVVTARVSVMKRLCFISVKK